MVGREEDRVRSWGRLTLTMAIAAAVLYIVVAGSAVVVPFILGLILAWIVLPVVNWIERHLPAGLQRHGIARLIAIFALYAIILGLIVAFFYYFIPRVSSEARSLLAELPRLFAGLQSILAGVDQWIRQTFPPSIQNAIFSQVPTTPEALLALLTSAFFRGLATPLSINWEVIFAYVIVPFWLIYVLYDTERLRRAGLSLFSESMLADVVNIGRILNEVAGAYIRGQVLVAATVGILTAAGLYLLGVDFPIVLGVITAIGDLIPTFGPVIAAIPVVIIAAAEQPILALLAVLLLIGVQQLENLLIAPQIIANLIRLRPALIMILLLIAGYLWGLLGLLLVVPLTAVSRDIAQYLYARTGPWNNSPNEALKRVIRYWQEQS